jgi:hypothetical protein
MQPASSMVSPIVSRGLVEQRGGHMIAATTQATIAKQARKTKPAFPAASQRHSSGKHFGPDLLLSD